jgi:hypothetical protein
MPVLNSTGKYAAAAALVLVVAGCGGSSSSDVNLESLGLAIEADIQAGARFGVAVPAPPDTTIEVALAPPGVAASMSEAGDGSLWLEVVVDAGTPRGGYALALDVVQDGEAYEVAWPFDVTEATGVATTEPGSVAALLSVDVPEPGATFPSPSTVRGQASTPTVDYLLVGGADIVLAEGTTDVVDGEFEAEVAFTNTCCVEMRLEVYLPGGSYLTIPVTYPESG